MAILAIKGHLTRGSEVIALLEMLGGVNTHNLYGDENYSHYTIDDNKEIIGSLPTDKFVFFTLEDFLEKYPYKVGDKVEYIKYDNEYPDVYTICNIKWTGNTIEYTLDSFGLTCLAKDIRLYKKPKRSKELESLNVETYLKVWDETEKGLEVVVNDKFKLKEDNGKFYIIKKQPQYPKTYEECHELMVQWKECDCNPNSELILCDAPIHDFCKLIVARNAYWKIAGEQMGLGKPWEPKHGYDEEIFFIYCDRVNGINKGQGFPTDNFCLTFPTKEMRDAFYNNFKDLIENVKELL